MTNVSGTSSAKSNTPAYQEKTVRRTIATEMQYTGPNWLMVGIAGGLAVGAAVLGFTHLNRAVKATAITSALVGATVVGTLGVVMKHKVDIKADVLFDGVKRDDVLTRAREASGRVNVIREEGKTGYTLFRSDDGPMTAAFVEEGKPALTSGDTGGWPFGSPSRYDFGFYDDENFVNALPYDARLTHGKERDASEVTPSDYRTPTE